MVSPIESTYRKNGPASTCPETKILIRMDQAHDCWMAARTAAYGSRPDRPRPCTIPGIGHCDDGKDHAAAVDHEQVSEVGAADEIEHGTSLRRGGSSCIVTEF